MLINSAVPTRLDLKWRILCVRIGAYERERERENEGQGNERGINRTSRAHHLHLN